MTKWRRVIYFLLLVVSRKTVEAIEPVKPDPDLIAQIDGLFELAITENYRTQGLDLMKESLDLCLKRLDTKPMDYELLWRCARSAVELGETAKILQTKDWKTICSSMARKSIEWTDGAKRKSPGRVEGHFWQMKAMGLLFEAEGAVSFLTKGLAAKCRQNLDACYAIDRSYLDYTPVLAMALYLYTLPPLFGRDTNKAIEYFEEYAAFSHWSFESWRQYTCAAELLMSTRKTEDVARARGLILAALADPTPRPYYHDLARSLLAKVDRYPR